jgi:hypothetical protein
VFGLIAVRVVFESGKNYLPDISSISLLFSCRIVMYFMTLLTLANVCELTHRGFLRLGLARSWELRIFEKGASSAPTPSNFNGFKQ